MKKIKVLIMLISLGVTMSACNYSKPLTENKNQSVFSERKDIPNVYDISSAIVFSGNGEFIIEPTKVKRAGNHFYVPLKLEHSSNFMVDNEELILKILDTLEHQFDGVIVSWQFKGFHEYYLSGIWFDLQPNETAMKTDTATVNQRPVLVSKTGYYKYNRREYLFFPEGGTLEKTFGMTEEEALDYAMLHGLEFRYENGQLFVTVKAGQKFVKEWRPVQ